MKKLVMGLLLALVAVFCLAQQNANPPAKQTPAQPAAQTAQTYQHPPMTPHPEFDRMKQLVGRWEGKSPEGPVVATFRLTGDSSALMQLLAEGSKQEMLTVFHPDGPNVMGTHYCAMHNQPRFVAVPSNDPKVMTFKFKDVTNLESPDAGHIQDLVITFVDPDHHIEEWSSVEKGKVVGTMKMEFTRVKGKG